MFTILVAAVALVAGWVIPAPAFVTDLVAKAKAKLNG